MKADKLKATQDDAMQAGQKHLFAYKIFKYIFLDFNRGVHIIDIPPQYQTP